MRWTKEMRRGYVWVSNLYFISLLGAFIVFIIQTSQSINPLAISAIELLIMAGVATVIFGVEQILERTE